MINIKVNSHEQCVPEGMEIVTRAPEIEQARAAALEKIANVHNKDCVSCVRTGNCEWNRKRSGCDLRRRGRRYGSGFAYRY